MQFLRIIFVCSLLGSLFIPKSSRAASGTCASELLRLQRYVADQTPIVRKAVRLATQGLLPPIAHPRPLCGRVCGLATYVLEYLVQEQDFSTSRYLNLHLQLPAPITAHMVLIVNIHGREILVDPAYLQFIEPLLFRLPPFSNVLIIPLDQLHSELKFFLKFRRQNINQLNRGDRLLREVMMQTWQLGWSDERIMEDYLLKIWNIHRKPDTDSLDVYEPVVDSPTLAERVRQSEGIPHGSPRTEQMVKFLRSLKR